MTDYLYHHGIKGMKWGVRRFQNPDGTLTDAGKRRYSIGRDHAKTDWDFERDRQTTRRMRDPMGEQIRDAQRQLKQRIRDTTTRVYAVDPSRVQGVRTGVNDISSGVNHMANASKRRNRYTKNHETLTSEEMAQISDKELQQINNRLQMETNYTSLTTEPRFIDYVSTGLTYASAMMSIAVGALTIYNQVRK